MRHIDVAKKDGMFYGWPANNGMWQWGDEIVFGMTEGHYKDLGPGKHAIDTEAGSRLCFARSFDKGETWSLEYPVFKNPDTEALWKFPPDEQIDEDFIPSCPGGYDFNGPGFGIMFSNMGTPAPSRSWFYVTTDRWHTWTGPWRVPGFGQMGMTMRTDYMVLDSKTLLCGMTGVKSTGFEGNAFAARLCDGGSRWEQLGFMGEQTPKDAFRIMPTIQRLDDGSLLAMTRWANEGYVEVKYSKMECFKSTDEGATWVHSSTVADTQATGAGNPPASAKLADGRVLMVFGQRFEPRGIIAVTTRDGVNWSEQRFLRSDAACGDMGYPRLVIRSDGLALTVYYYNLDEHAERFVGATIFEP